MGIYFLFDTGFQYLALSIRPDSNLSRCNIFARDAFVRTNRRTFAMIFVHLSVCLGWACIVIILCTFSAVE